MKIREILTAIFLGFFLGSCSIYRVVHEETPQGELTHYKTSIFQMVPPGGKELSSGQANISAQSKKNEKWRIKIGADTETDMDGTAQLLMQMFEAGKMAGGAAVVP